MIELGIFSSVHLLARTYLAELLIEEPGCVEAAPLDEADALLSQHIRLMREGGPLGSAGWGVEEQRELVAKSARERERRYWASRIRAGRTGWDQAEPNAHLVKLFAALPAKPKHVLVPLCGMSVDLLWLASQGCLVTGAEFCKEACERLFTKASVPFTVDAGATTATGHPALLFRGGAITIWCCDFTFLSRPDMAVDNRPPVDLVWDRASIVAIPIPTRQTYVNTIVDLAQPGSTVLTCVGVYSKEERAKSKAGYTSPYLVPKEELQQLYSNRDVETVVSVQVTLEPRHLTDWGITSLKEEVYRLKL
jgi:thiopurine S-methyltransferase